MKNKVLFLLLTFSVLALPVRAGGQQKRWPWFSRAKQMESQNVLLKARLDSLQELLDSVMAVKAVEDNAVDALIDADNASSYYSAPDSEQADSLLNLWYETSRTPSDFDVAGNFGMDSTTSFSSNVPDSVMIRRLQDMNAFITLPFNETVRRYMVLYSEKMGARMGRILGLSAYYFPIFEETFARYGIPLELKYMSVIESMLSPTATSRAGAKGMWQFMYRTARVYGLNVDSFIDERMDVFKAADAAARYLKDAYNVFGDWTLAISSYNCGPGNVSKAIRRAGSKDFWSIYPFLPRETRGYMPAFVGAMYAMTYWREYGLKPVDVGLPAMTDTVMISRKLHFKQINEVVGVPMEDIQHLNPQYVHEIIPGTSKEACPLTLPYKWVGPFIDMEDKDTLYNHRLKQLMSDDVLKAAENHRSHTRTAYKVKNGDYLGRIASKHHVTVSQIKKWNHLRSDKIRVGQILYIYPR